MFGINFGHPSMETPQGVREVYKDKTVCSICHAVMKYMAGNTTNMMRQFNQNHPEYSSNSARNVSQSDSKPVPCDPTKQQTLRETFQIKEKMSFISGRLIAITN